MPTLNESIVEDATLTWFRELGYVPFWACSYLKANRCEHPLGHLTHLFSISCLFKRKPE